MAAPLLRSNPHAHQALVRLVAASCLLLVIPGPTVALIVSYALAQIGHDFLTTAAARAWSRWLLALRETGIILIMICFGRGRHHRLQPGRPRETALMSTDLWKPKSITLIAHASSTQTVTLTLACVSIELKPVTATSQSQWIVKVKDTRGLAAADWQSLSFVDSEGMRRACSVDNVREVKPGVLAMTRT